jgi:hypothetical protein
MSQILPELENLKFKIGLSGTYWGKKPQYSILLNKIKLHSGEITEPSDQIFYIEFQAECTEDSDNILEIRLENKEDSDTVQNAERTEILKDMLLNIHSIEIDEIAMDQLIWSKSQFLPDDAARPLLDNCVNLGWNGSYTFKFTSPFYLWLLESL